MILLTSQEQLGEEEVRHASSTLWSCSSSALVSTFVCNQFQSVQSGSRSLSAMTPYEEGLG